MATAHSPRHTTLLHKWDSVKTAHANRDARHHDLLAARSGEFEEITGLADFFPEAWPKSVIANTIDIASTDLGEMCGPLPTVSCPPTRTTIDKSRKAAEKRTRIVNGYLSKSQVQRYMYGGADGFFCFGFLPLVVEPDFEEQTPVIRVDNPVGAYYELDFFGRTKFYFKRWFESLGSIKAKFPQIEAQLNDNYSRYELNDATQIEVVKYYGPEYFCIFAPDLRDGLILAEADNPMGSVPVFVAERPKWDSETRGQFDQTIWVQMARAKMALNLMDVADQAVNAPTILPRDAGQLVMGPKAILRTDNPQGVGRLKIEVPNQVFAENEAMRQEERVAARYPEGRSGNIDASVITGQGVEALLGTMSSQIKVAQDQIKWAVGAACSFALKMDLKFFGEVEKTTAGSFESERFRERYTPSKDIDDFEVDTTYGMMSGMDFSRALVAMLQMRGDKLVSRSLVRRHLPEGMGGVEVEQEIDIEDFGDAMKQAIFAYVQQGAVPGTDPATVLARVARMMDNRSKGETLHESILKALEPTEEEKAAMEAQQAAMAAANPVGAALTEAGTPPEAPGSVAASPGGSEGMGSIQQIMARLTSSGQPQMSAGVNRMLPAP